VSSRITNYACTGLQIRFPQFTSFPVSQLTSKRYPEMSLSSGTAKHKAVLERVRRSDENLPEKFKSENFLENFPEKISLFFYKDS
jgi:hypothetical protein